MITVSSEQKDVDPKGRAKPTTPGRSDASEGNGKTQTFQNLIYVTLTCVIEREEPRKGTDPVGSVVEDMIACWPRRGAPRIKSIPPGPCPWDS